MSFVDRQAEQSFLDSILTRRHPGPAQLVLLYGRRRVGKTSLLRHWVGQSGIDNTYWVADKEIAPLQRRRLYASLLNVSPQNAPTFDGWPDVWEAVADYLKDRRYILVVDELPYAAEADPAMLSALQNAWDQHFKGSNVVLVLCGSQVRVMESLLNKQSPLFGRMTGQWELKPLPYACLAEFFPDWSAEERVGAYAIVGGIPAYLEWLDPADTLRSNIQHVLLSPGSMFLAEPTFLLYEEVSEPRTYLAILKAIGAGHHGFTDISTGSLVPKSNLSQYLTTLQDLRLVERRLPATVPPPERRTSRRGRYHLSDAYFRFYFRFLAPGQEAAVFEPARLLQEIEQGMQSFVGQTAFEDLAREWVAHQAKQGRLPFSPETLGSHWSSDVQVDVVAVNWKRRHILLGECTWSRQPMSHETVVQLLESKTPLVLRDLPDQGTDWSVHHVFFARQGFSRSAQEAAHSARATLVDLATLDTDLLSPI